MVLASNTRLRGPRMRSMSIGEVHSRLIDEQDSKEDLEIRGRDVLFNEDGSLSIRGVGHRLSMNKWAFGQFCNRLEIPTEFLRRSPTGSGSGGRKAIVDYWKENIDGQMLLLRTRKLEQPDPETGATGLVRAVLTTRYSKFDNLEYFEMLRPLIEKHNMDIQIGHTDDQSFHLRLLGKEKIDVSLPGSTPDLHKVGIHALNSEVGYSDIKGDFLIYREICTNGMIALHDSDHLYKQRHLNVERHEIRSQVLSGLDKVERYGHELLEQVRESRSVEIPNPVIYLERQLKSAKATDEFVEATKRAYEEEPGNSKFMVVQAITRAAQRFPMDVRTSMETFAGRLLIAA